MAMSDKIEESVRERPILFSGPMVRAILEGKKTQTRRVVKQEIPIHVDQCSHGKVAGTFDFWSIENTSASLRNFPLTCPYGKPGDRLWVKTGYTTRYDHDRNETHWKTEGGWITTHGQALSKTGKPKRDGGHPGRFMPKWLSQEFRLPPLEITDIRVQRLQEISEEDAIAEGAQCAGFPASLTNRSAFGKLWEKINGKGSWDANPFVWCVSFKRVEESR